MIPVCPETLAGLPVPRPPVKSRKGRIFETDPETRQTIGCELTEVFQAGASKALRIAIEAGAAKAFFFKLSPSCAPTGVAGKMFKAAGIEVLPIY
ncbi:MAG: DUF523 domain-containing protein [Desulfobacteraceae bacterium]|nr:DUF523 domain-containing protein [Desulfobacteraceae bacterium]